ncbi:mini-chromosome maintenance complex-binding protein isoform X2 [Orussus abietinus]|uniref:mini-chromosome maintenance complex-binding protein isoform X2 n=1 Tax=Orussus abietinus TaxID=222816 RepID=UPI0006250CCB|nr:mini-chromosome maintenance complex-binding protein isoform X2 [Orussus abietinus]
MSYLSHVMTLANGVIGVSVLAMPFCFEQCGIILATVVLLLSSALSRLACHLLIKSAVMSRRRNFEFLAFHAFGRTGKIIVELFIVGFLIGTCVAFFVVVGDLGPQIIGKIIDRQPEDIRTSFLIITGVFIVLPLGLLRNVDSLSSICTASIGFYLCLVLKIVAESTRHIFAGDWYDRVYYWRPAGILRCLPIFSMALFCQTQLFEIYETVPNASLEKMNEIVRGALNICNGVYICVGFFGYIAFCNRAFSDFGTWNVEHYLKNLDTCTQILENSDALQEIPSLNCLPLHDLRHGQLVRFRGMIQDMYDPEYYFEHYEVENKETGESYLRCGKYTDCARCSSQESIRMNSEKNQSCERQTYILISIPGLNDWAKEKNVTINKEVGNISSTCNKRNLRDDESEDMDCSEPISKKEKVSSDPDNPFNESKPQSIQPQEYVANFPIPITNGRTCIVKIYEERTTFKLNQVLDVIGFVSLDPRQSLIYDSEENDPEVRTHNPPASLVPRLHALKLILLSNSKSNFGPQNSPAMSIQHIRGDLHMVLSQLLFGDELAAEYLICHMISSNYMRNDYLCLGSFPMNITDFPITRYTSFPKELYEVLSEFLPKTHFLEISLSCLNDANLTPKKDYDTNRLTSGVLQLSDNTHLIIDETKLSSGQVTQSGRQNYAAIDSLIKFQKVAYDFKYYTMEYEVDIPVLILSEAKSFVPGIMQVPLKTEEETSNLYPQILEATKHFLKDENRLNDIRRYLEASRHADFQFNEEISNVDHSRRFCKDAAIR